MQGARVQPLVRELRSYRLPGASKKKSGSGGAVGLKSIWEKEPVRKIRNDSRQIYCKGRQRVGKWRGVVVRKAALLG